MKKLIGAVVMVVAVVTGANAQGRQQAPLPTPPAPAPQRAQAPPPPPPAPSPGMFANVRIEIAVIDEGGPQTLRENVILTTVDHQEASLRSDANVQDGPVILNVDATPQVSGLPSGKIRVRVGLDYLPNSADPKQRGARTRLQFAVIVDDGKRMVVSDTSDPATDRRVRVELTATLLK